jgi:hypothetical protein
MNIAWYARRARAMSGAELRHRMARHASYAADAGLWRLPPLRARRWPPHPTRRASRPPVGFLTEERAASVAVGFPDGSRQLVESARNSAERRFQFFGYPDCRLAAPIDFSRDPFSQRRWPPKHAKFLNYRNAVYGDPKWIWELNRLQHLPKQVAASFVADEPALADLALASAVEWVHQQPVGRGIAWANGFEAGLRAISLALVWDSLNASMSGTSRDLIARSLEEHARWILFDPSRHSSANNHRIGELVGLATIALIGPQTSDTKRWLNYAMAELERESELQVQDDGTGAEQAFAYHVFVCDLLLLVVSLADASASDPPQGILAALERSGYALWAQMGISEPAPRYGDADDGRAFTLDGAPLRDPRGVAAAIAARLGTPESRATAGELDMTTMWLFGDPGRTRFTETAPAAEPGDVRLRDVAIVRRSGTRVTVDAGTHGYLAIAAHGHADALAVTIAAGSEDVIVDPGVGSYFGNPARRTYFRGTSAHATVTVDDLDQSVSAGPFSWHDHARAWFTLVEFGKGIVLGEHDGYGRLADPVRHRRLVLTTPEGVVVYDRMDAIGTHTYRQRWPLGPSLTVTVDDSGLRAENRTTRVAAAFAASAPARLRIIEGEEHPAGGWWSDRLESMRPAPVVSWDTETAGGVEIAAFFDLHPVEEATPRLALDRRGNETTIRAIGASGDQTSVTIALDREENRVRVDTAASERAAVGT